jgi:choline dehydrogenase
MSEALEFDYVIGGAGSAGCVLARRLADAGNTVLLIEAGPRDNTWVIRMPAGLRSIFKPSSRYNYWFETEPQRNLDNRRIQQPRGRVLGGSSSINGMTGCVAIRSTMSAGSRKAQRAGAGRIVCRTSARSSGAMS